MPRRGSAAAGALGLLHEEKYRHERDGRPAQNREYVGKRQHCRLLADLDREHGGPELSDELVEGLGQEDTGFGSRLVEIVNGVKAGDSVVSPARPELADGEKVSAEQLPKLAVAETPKVATAPEATTTVTPAPKVSGGEFAVDPDISAALAANVQSLVNDARRSALRSVKP